MIYSIAVMQVLVIGMGAYCLAKATGANTKCAIGIGALSSIVIAVAFLSGAKDFLVSLPIAAIVVALVSCFARGIALKNSGDNKSSRTMLFRFGCIALFAFLGASKQGSILAELLTLKTGESQGPL